MESRIKQLRENRGLIQEILVSELGITQQMLSKYERDVLCIKVDVLKRIAEYFNVTTDYLLGVSEVKRDLQGQMKVNKTLDTYYDLIEIYKGLDEYDQEMVWSIMQTVKKTCEKRKRDKVAVKIIVGIYVFAGICTLTGMNAIVSLVAVTMAAVLISQYIGVVKYKIEKR